MTARAEPRMPSAEEGIAGEISQQRRCAGTTADGAPCNVPEHLVRWSEDDECWWCFSHDPALDAERAVRNEKGGIRATAKARKWTFLDAADLGDLETPADAKRWASKLALAVATGRLTAGAASVVKALLEQFVRSLEAVDHDARIARLEAQVLEDRQRAEAERVKAARKREESGGGFLTTATAPGGKP